MSAAIRAAAQTETAGEKVARILAAKATGAATRTTFTHADVIESTLPTADVELITLTLDELHDLVYAAATTANRTTTLLTLEHSRRLAQLAAETARPIARRHDGLHRGADPRA